MKHLYSAIFIVFWMSFSMAQSIHVDQLNQDFKSYFIPSEKAFADSILNAGDFTISLTSLKKYCESPNNCFEVSIIQEKYDDLSDTLFWYPQVERIRTDLFDFIVPLESADYELILSEVLLGDVPVEDDRHQIKNMCYNPRHAILIKDSANEIVCVYEICFECGKVKIAFSRIESVEGIPGVIYEVFSRYGLK